MTAAQFHAPKTWSPFGEEYVLDDLLTWQREGLRTALVSLINIDGTTPRALGAQMAVAEDGRFRGYLSGGCLEQAVALEAVNVISEGANRHVRFGRGSRYLDIKLPCGSGLDLYFDQNLPTSVLDAARVARICRQPFSLRMDVASGRSEVHAIEGLPRSFLRESTFERGYAPPLRLMILGSGPSMVALAHVATSAGFECLIATPEDHTRRALTGLGIPCYSLTEVGSYDFASADQWTAAALMFHNHDYEAAILSRLLRSRAFYIGALGSKAAHLARVDALKKNGTMETEVARIRSPIGLINGAKSRGLLASGIVSEILSVAKADGLTW